MPTQVGRPGGKGSTITAEQRAAWKKRKPSDITQQIPGATGSLTPVTPGTVMPGGEKTWGKNVVMEQGKRAPSGSLTPITPGTVMPGGEKTWGKNVVMERGKQTPASNLTPVPPEAAAGKDLSGGATGFGRTYLNTFAGYNPEDNIKAMYRAKLGRDPTDAEIKAAKIDIGSARIRGETDPMALKALESSLVKAGTQAGLTPVPAGTTTPIGTPTSDYWKKYYADKSNVNPTNPALLLSGEPNPNYTGGEVTKKTGYQGKAPTQTGGAVTQGAATMDEVYKLTRFATGMEPDDPRMSKNYVEMARAGASMEEIIAAVGKETAVSGTEHERFFKSLGLRYDPAEITSVKREYGLATEVPTSPLALMGEMMGTETAGGEGGEITAPDQIQPYLEEFQAKQLEAEQVREGIAGTIKTPEEIRAEILAYLPSEAEMPTPPDLVATYEQLLVEKGVTGLETQLNALKEQERDVQAQMRERSTAEAGKAIPMGVIAGRVGEIERQEMERLDFIGRQKATVIDELNTKYSAINTVMTLTNQNYSNAKEFYEAKFSRAMQVQSLFMQAETAQRAEQWKQYEALVAEGKATYEVGRDVFEANMQLAELVQKTASANLTVYANMLSEGNITWDSLNPDQQFQVQKLEIMAGMPAGTMSMIRSKAPTDEIIGTNVNAGLVQVIMRDKNGNLRTETFGQETHTQLLAESEAEAKRRFQEEQILRNMSKSGEAQDEVTKQTSDFMLDLFNPSKLGIKQGIATHGEELGETYPGEEGYISREYFIAKLKAKWGAYFENPFEIDRKVYEAYPD